MGIISTQGFTFRLIANGTELDLFADEDYLISDNVTGLFDIGVLPADFTRQILLPGSKTNNAFFEHVYDISIVNPFLFATNQKVPAYFDFDSVYISQGYLQLNKVNVKANKFIESYEVTIFGSLSSFARDLKTNFLTNLDVLNVYNHTSSLENITSSWEGNLFNGAIVYPMAEYGQKIQYTQTDNFYGIDDQSGSLAIQDYKPAIRVKEVFDACFEQFGYTYTSSFMNEGWLDDVYMVCNNQLRYPLYENYGINLEKYGLFKMSAVSGSGVGLLSDGVAKDFTWYNIEQNPYNSLASNLVYTLPTTSSIKGTLNLDFKITNTGVGTGYPKFYLTYTNQSTSTTYSSSLDNYNNYFIQLREYWISTGTDTPTQTYTLDTGFLTETLPAGTYKFGIKYDLQFGSAGNFTLTVDPGDNPKSYMEVTKLMQAGAGLIIDIPSNMPKGTAGIRLIDFLTGFQKKFNLVIYPDRTTQNRFIVETFNNWYNKGQRKDFNKYINLDENIEVIPANNLAVNELNFGDKLDGDYVSQQFSKGEGREFGKTYYIDRTNYFSQGKYEVETTFASSPLLKIAGTGVSGSVADVNPPTSNCTSYTLQFNGFAGGAVSWDDCYGSYQESWLSESNPQITVCAKTGTVSGDAIIINNGSCG
jgi:hypothetical protein